MSTRSTLIKEELVNCLTQQLSEIDLLKSMYPNPGDIVLSDKNVTEISNFIDSNSDYIPNSLDFVINLLVSDLKLETFINLPLSYPNEEPEICIRCNQLNRQQETSLNTELSKFIKNHVGEVCLYTAITWLQDNIETFTTQNVRIIENSSKKTVQTENKFSRLWIYSHHIYNKKKREDIAKLAREFELKGFCLPGKPGVICVEGNSQACNEWWKVIKSMSWKKITIRKTEIYESFEEPEQKKFHNFEELHLSNPNKTKHSNMSEFSKFMNKHGFEHIFSNFFGLDNE